MINKNILQKKTIFQGFFLRKLFFAAVDNVVRNVHWKTFDNFSKLLGTFSMSRFRLLKFFL